MSHARAAKRNQNAQNSNALPQLSKGSGYVRLMVVVALVLKPKMDANVALRLKLSMDARLAKREWTEA